MILVRTTSHLQIIWNNPFIHNGLDIVLQYLKPVYVDIYFRLKFGFKTEELRNEDREERQKPWKMTC